MRNTQLRKSINPNKDWFNDCLNNKRLLIKEWKIH